MTSKVLRNFVFQCLPSDRNRRPDGAQTSSTKTGAARGRPLLRKLALVTLSVLLEVRFGKSSWQRSPGRVSLLCPSHPSACCHPKQHPVRPVALIPSLSPAQGPKSSVSKHLKEDKFHKTFTRCRFCDCKPEESWPESGLARRGPRPLPRHPPGGVSQGLLPATSSDPQCPTGNGGAGGRLAPGVPSEEVTMSKPSDSRMMVAQGPPEAHRGRGVGEQRLSFGEGRQTRVLLFSHSQTLAHLA